MRVSSLMVRDVKTVGPSVRLLAVYDLMDRHRIRHVPVVDEEGKVAGLVSHRDLLSGALSGLEAMTLSSQRDYLRSRRVRSAMVLDPLTVPPDTSVLEAAALMLENKFGCLLVTEDRRLVGILTEADFVRYVAEREGR